MKTLQLPRIGFVVFALLAGGYCKADNGWPRQLQTTAATVLLYQPQIESFQGNTLSAHCALSIQNMGQPAADWGAVGIDAEMQIDRDTRTMTPTSVTVTSIRFPNASPERLEKIRAFVQNRMATFDQEFSLDGVLAQLQSGQKGDPAGPKIFTDPPQIIFTDRPTVLVTFDGTPQMQKIAKSKMMQVVNTPFFVAFDPTEKTYYLKGGDIWYSAPDALGPWQSGATPPGEISAAAQEEFNDGSGDELKEADLPDVTPEIMTTTVPAELIQTDGAPVYTQIKDTDLQYVSNTESDVFMETGTNKVFVLLSGRWYTADSQDGPWTYVPSDQLPADFAKIPEDSPKGNVLASIKGTQAATEAMLDADIPQTTYVKTGSNINVQYDGEPQFATVDGTNLQYAVNSPYSVVRSGTQYYCCDQGVWYNGQNAAGPYYVANEIPDVIYTIPPTCPLYNCCYARIYGQSSDYICCGYTPGYLGCYPCNGTVVYGTGCSYAPWFGNFYYPRPCTWGFGARFNPWRCSWGFGCGFETADGFHGIGIGRGPNGWFGIGAGAAGGWFGPSGYHFHRPNYIASYYRHRENQLSGTHFLNVNRFSNIYRSPVSKALDMRHDPRLNAALRNQIKETRNYTYHPQTARTAAAVRSANAHSGTLITPSRAAARNNVFADRDGHVFQRSKNGWEVKSQTGWIRAGQKAPEEFQNLRQPSVLQPAQAQRQTPTRRTDPVQALRAQMAHDEAQNQAAIRTNEPRPQRTQTNTGLIYQGVETHAPERSQGPLGAPFSPYTAAQRSRVQASPPQQMQNSNSFVRELEAQAQARERGAQREANFQRASQPQFRPQIQVPRIAPQQQIHPTFQSQPAPRQSSFSPAARPSGPAPVSRPSSNTSSSSGRRFR